MVYGRRKKGGQRLMEMSRAGAKRKAARKAKTLAQAKANIAKGPVTRGGAKKKVAAKSTAAGRNKTALRTPRGAGSVAKKKKVAAPKSDAGKYMGPYSKRTTSAKKKTPASRPRSVMRADNPTLTERARRFAEKLFPSHMGMKPYAPSMGDAALEVGKRYIGSRVAGGGLSAARNPKKALTAVSGAASKVGSAAKDVAKSAIAQTRRRPMPKVSADKAKAGVKRQQQRVDPVGKQVTTPKPKNKKAADQKNLERQQRAGVKGARSDAAKKVLKEAENKKPAKTVSKEVLSKASSKNSGPKYRSTAKPKPKMSREAREWLLSDPKAKAKTPGKKKAAKKKTTKK